MAEDEKAIDSISGDDESEETEHTYDRMDFDIVGTTLVKYMSKRPVVVIPEFVTEIGDSAFHYCAHVTSVTLPDGLKSIGVTAFCGCHDLTSIKFPEGLKTIKDRAFCGSGLTEVTIPRSVETVGDAAFTVSLQLERVVIDGGDTKVDDNAFSTCKMLRFADININALNAFKNTNVEELTVCGDVSGCVFDGMPNLRTLRIASGSFGIVQSDMIAACGNLKQLILPKEAVVSDKGALSTLQSLISLTLPSLSKNGMAYLFGNNVPSSLKFVTVLGGAIHNGAFGNCKKLTEVTLGDEVTCVWNGAFDGCSELRRVFIPKSVTAIGNYVFAGCKKAAVYCEAIEKPRDWDDDWNIENNTVYWNSKVVDGYMLNYPIDGEKYESPLSDFRIDGDSVQLYLGESSIVVIPNDIKNIERSLFVNFRHKITGIFIPESVNSIENGTFDELYNLAKISVAGKNKKYCVKNNVLIEKSTKQAICRYADYKLLDDGSIKILGTHLFYWDHAITSCAVPNGVTQIMEYCFASCRNLISVDIPVSVKFLGFEAFYQCTKLTDIRYGGKISQWKKIKKFDYWDDYTDDYTVHCTDGDIKKGE